MQDTSLTPTDSPCFYVSLFDLSFTLFLFLYLRRCLSPSLSSSLSLSPLHLLLNRSFHCLLFLSLYFLLFVSLFHALSLSICAAERDSSSVLSLSLSHRCPHAFSSSFCIWAALSLSPTRPLSRRLCSSCSLFFSLYARPCLSLCRPLFLPVPIPPPLSLTLLSHVNVPNHINSPMFMYKQIHKRV